MLPALENSICCIYFYRPLKIIFVVVEQQFFKKKKKSNDLRASMHMCAYNFKIKNILVLKSNIKSKSGYTIVCVLIIASKYGLTPLCFNDIFFKRNFFSVF